MRRVIGATALGVVLALTGCAGKEEVDVNPGKGKEGVGNPTKPDDQGSKEGGKEKKDDDVDVNPGKGKEGVGDPTQAGDQ